MRDVLKIAVISLGILATAIAVRGDEPTPAEPVAFTASANVTGTGKRSDPFIFDVTTKPVLKLSGAASDLQWDTEDGPTDIEAIGNVLVFSVAEPGEYVVFATWTGGKAKAWFRIGPRGPPTPVNALVSQLRAALVGPSATADAKKLASMTAALADAIQAGEFKDHGQMVDAWKSVQTSLKWPEGVYPAMPDVMRKAIPTMPRTTVLTPEFAAETVANLRVLEKTAGLIAEGK